MYQIHYLVKAEDKIKQFSPNNKAFIGLPTRDLLDGLFHRKQCFSLSSNRLHPRQTENSPCSLGDITAQTGCVPPHYNNVTPPHVVFVVGCPGYKNISLKRTDEETWLESHWSKQTHSCCLNASGRIQMPWPPQQQTWVQLTSWMYSAACWTPWAFLHWETGQIHLILLEDFHQN